MSWQEEKPKKLGRPADGEKRKTRINITIDDNLIVVMDSLNINKSKLIESLLLKELNK